MFYYLCAIVPLPEVSEVHSRIVQVAVELRQFDDAELVIRESLCMILSLWRDLLDVPGLATLVPSSIIAIFLSMIDGLVEYFVHNKQVKFIDGNLQRIVESAKATSRRACNAHRQPFFCG